MKALLLALALTGCTLSLQPSGPSYVGADYSRERLVRIADAPSDAGAREAMQRWIAHPDWPEAQQAVFRSVPTYHAPVESAFARLDASQQELLIAHLGTVKSSAASAMLVRLSTRADSTDDAIAALAGRSDNDATDGLLALAGRSDLAVDQRIAAVRALAPATDWRKQDGLLALVQGAEQPEALRVEAVTVMAPYTFDAPRAALVALVRAEDSAVSVRALEKFDAPRTVDEQGAFLEAAARSRTSAAAVGALNRAEPLPDAIKARFLSMVAPGAAPSDAGLRAGRVAAAAALTGRGDAAGGPALVEALDDAQLRGEASAALDRWIIDGVPTLRARGPACTSPEGRAEVARLLSRFGGPSDADAVGALAAPSERAALLDALRSSPYALFPSGTVRYAPATSDGAVVEHTLSEAIRAGRALRGTTDDPALAYLGAARAFLAGARSAADRTALEAAAAAARTSFRVWLRDDFGNTDWRVAEVVKGVGAFYAGALPGVALSNGAPTVAGLPAVSIGGSLTCSGQPRTERQTLPDGVHSYTLRVENPRKKELQRVVDTWPYDQRTVSSCEKTCACNVPGQGLQTYKVSCDSAAPNVGEWCNCMPETTYEDDPGFAAAKADLAAEPAYVDAAFSVPMKRVRVTDIDPQQCDGTLRVAIGDAAHSARLAFGGERRASRVEGTATPLDVHGNAMTGVRTTEDEGVTDDRAERRAAALSTALSGYRPTIDQVRRMYAAAVGPAVAAGQLRAARDALLWSDPTLVATTAPELEAFRARLFSDGGRAFPAAP